MNCFFCLFFFFKYLSFFFFSSLIPWFRFPLRAFPCLGITEFLQLHRLSTKQLHVLMRVLFVSLLRMDFNFLLIKLFRWFGCAKKNTVGLNKLGREMTSTWFWNSNRNYYLNTSWLIVYEKDPRIGLRRSHGIVGCADSVGRGVYKQRWGFFYQISSRLIGAQIQYEKNRSLIWLLNQWDTWKGLDLVFFKIKF